MTPLRRPQEMVIRPSFGLKVERPLSFKVESGFESCKDDLSTFDFVLYTPCTIAISSPWVMLSESWEVKADLANERR